MTRARDALSAKRRSLPMVKLDKAYRFEGPEGSVGLADLFQGQRQLIMQHFMFDPSWDDGCPSCSAAADELSDGLLAHLRARSTAFVAVSRAPLAKLERYKTSRGWTFPWYSSSGSDFNYDFHVSKRTGRSRKGGPLSCAAPRRTSRCRRFRTRHATRSARGSRPAPAPSYRHGR